MWLKFKRAIQGVLVVGDPNVPPTTIWNWLPMKLWGWKMAAVLCVSDEVAARGYHIGYRPTVKGQSVVGKTRMNSDVFHDRVFRMRIGREACMFFVIDTNGNEGHLELLACSNIKAGNYRDKPLR